MKENIAKTVNLWTKLATMVFLLIAASFGEIRKVGTYLRQDIAQILDIVNKF